jgi:hypothetical protein
MPGELIVLQCRRADGRNYLTQDIVRRILRDYFGYDVNFVMNITDIDDKVCRLMVPIGECQLTQDHPSSPRITSHRRGYSFQPRRDP